MFDVRHRKSTKSIAYRVTVYLTALVLCFTLVSGAFFGSSAVVWSVYQTSHTEVQLPAQLPSRTALCLQLQANTVVIYRENGHASGVLFTRDGVTFILTAAHVADVFRSEDGSFGDVTFRQGDVQGKAMVLRSGDKLRGVDCALLEVIEGDFRGINCDAFAPIGMIPALGAEIIHCGCPMDQENFERIVMFGTVTGPNRQIGEPFRPVEHNMDSIDISCYPGCSGGPVISAETGVILGIVTQGKGVGLILIEPTRNILKWAEENGCIWAFDRSVPLPEDRTAPQPEKKREPC